MDKNIGRKLDGRYEITELIGVGGMADVYKATDILEDRVVAVKILKNEFADNEDFVRRFRNESKAIAVLSHPNIVKIYDVGFTDKIQFIVMEYIDGITLKEFIEQQGVLKWKDTVHFIIQILRALQHAHDRGIVHRDIKPQNIMLFPDGTIKVMDFGIARFAREEGKTISDKAIGSVHYISPEQARGDITDEKSDIYSVGVMMYEMLTGVKPFDADNPVTVALMHMQNTPKPPREINDSIPEGLEEIVLRAMQKEASKRYQSASEMIKDIEEFKKNPSIVFEYKYLTEEKTQYYNAGAVSKAAAAAAYEANSNEKGSHYADKGDERKIKTKTKVRKKELPEEYEDYNDYEEEEKVSKSSYFVVILTAIAAGILIIVVAFIAIAFMKALNVEKTEIGQMPNIVGYSYQEVKTYYANLFEVNVESQEYSSEYPEGAIISQNPAEGRDYLIGKAVVKVTVSKGPRMVTIPNVYELDSNTAQSMLHDNNGFNVIIKSVFDDEVDKDTVIMTDPPRNEQAEYGSTVYLYVSRGPEEQDIIVPNVVGYDIDAAKTLLGDKFTVQVMKQDSAEPENTVIEQSIPSVGDDGKSNVVPINSTIILTVSTGVAPEAEEVITFKIPSGIKGGSATFNCYYNGNIVGTEKIDNVAYASTVSVTIKGSGIQKIMLEAVNNDTKESATIGEYTVDYEEGTVTETSFEKKIFKNLFADEEETTTQNNEPQFPAENGDNDGNAEDDEVIDLNDDDFWESILNGY
ncbi:MAG: Stk1 family PASTA domain-containing Ser/Thr kinase [Oscillospiraceae bacterium]